MFAIAFDLQVKALKKHYGKTPTSAYGVIRGILGRHGFNGIQGSVYTNDNDDMTKVFLAISDLRAVPWIRACVRDIRAFKVENWSDFTAILKTAP